MFQVVRETYEATRKKQALQMTACGFSLPHNAPEFERLSVESEISHLEFVEHDKIQNAKKGWGTMIVLSHISDTGPALETSVIVRWKQV